MSAGRTATVSVRSQPLGRLRLARRLPRYVMGALAVAGLADSARFALDPPRPVLPVRAPARPAGDLRAAGFAAIFTRAYLTFEASDPEARQTALAPFDLSGLGAEAGMQPPLSGSDHVLYAQVLQERSPLPQEHVYTVAADTSAHGLLYLSVAVIRRADGSLALAGYPAFVGGPAISAADSAQPEGREVNDSNLRTVITRALTNYLAPAPSELAADLAPGANVSTPQIGLTLESVQSLTWAPGTGAVIAVVDAVGAGGARYTLSYELDVLRADGRWEIAAIQMDPNA